MTNVIDYIHFDSQNELVSLLAKHIIFNTKYKVWHVYTYELHILEIRKDGWDINMILGKLETQKKLIDILLQT